MERISLDEVDELRRRGQPVFILDARKEDVYQASATQAAGAIRVSPDAAAESVAALGLPRDAWLISYCT